MNRIVPISNPIIRVLDPRCFLFLYLRYLEKYELITDMTTKLILVFNVVDLPYLVGSDISNIKIDYEIDGIIERTDTLSNGVVTGMSRQEDKSIIKINFERVYTERFDEASLNIRPNLA